MAGNLTAPVAVPPYAGRRTVADMDVNPLDVEPLELPTEPEAWLPWVTRPGDRRASPRPRPRWPR